MGILGMEGKRLLGPMDLTMMLPQTVHNLSAAPPVGSEPVSFQVPVIQLTHLQKQSKAKQAKRSSIPGP